MACRQILPGRRWCRVRPFLVLLALAACLFYQTLTPLRTRRYLFALSNGALPSPGAEAWHGTYKKISARQIRCLLPSGNLQVQKELSEDLAPGPEPCGIWFGGIPGDHMGECPDESDFYAWNGEHFCYKGLCSSAYGKEHRNCYAGSKIEEDVFKYSRSQARAVILYIPSSGSKEDLLLYQHIFVQRGYAVTVLEDRKLSRHEIPGQDELHSSDLFICLSSTKIDHENCLNTIESHQTRLLQKANALPQIRRLLCRKEGLCQIVRTFPDLHLPIVLPCQESSVMPLYTVKPHNHNESTRLTHMRYPPIKNIQRPQKPVEVDRKGDFKIQDLSIIIKVYVLVTSLTPLRAFIHSSGIVWYAPKKKQFSVKLQTFFETFLGATSPQQALDDMKEAIIKLLLIAEVFGEAPSSGPHASGQCSSCFQMLTFDIGFSHSMHPVVLEVHEHFDFQVGEGSTLQDQTVKESLLEDTFRILLSNHTSSSTFFEALQNIYQPARLEDEPHQKELDHCLTLEQLNLMISFVQELQNLGQFELLFPSTVPKIRFLLHDLYRLLSPGENLGSVLSLHWLLSNLLEQLHVINKRTGTNLPRWKNKDSRNVSWMKAKWPHLRSSYLEQSRIKTKSSSPTNEKHEGLHSLNLFKETHCSHDKDTLPHIRWISTSPHLDLNPYFDPKIKEYYSEVPFEVVTVKIRAEAVNCRCEIHLDEKKGPSVAKYPLGLGINRINILVTDESQSLQEVVSVYKIIVYREDRPSLPLFDDFMVCGFVQDCGSIIHPKEPCGLQPLSAKYLSRISQPELKTCEKGDMKGQWIVPCLSCSDNRTCDWRQITWQPHDCQYPVLSKPELQQCLESKRVLFIGDSTNRGMMYYLIERVNKTLQEWQKAHDMKFYHNVNNRNTFISYSYYPQFWISINQRPTFEDALEQLLFRSQPLENTRKTILIVGGVQWLNFNHLHIIQKVLKRANLSNILVMIKSLGMGFHLPVDGVHSLSQAEVQNLWNENQAILNTAKQYGYEVVDTFIITMGRYKEFLQGKCGCHFHEVVNSKSSKGNFPVGMTLSKPYALGKYFNNQSNLVKLQAYASNSQSPYHVRGPINQVYSEILLSRICANERQVIGP